MEPLINQRSPFHEFLKDRIKLSPGFYKKKDRLSAFHQINLHPLAIYNQNKLISNKIYQTDSVNVILSFGTSETRCIVLGVHVVMSVGLIRWPEE